jgi:protein-disulfide isomerase
MIVEFADFECRYCAKVALELAKLKARYPKDVALVFRHFPLSGIHPNAWQAARAAECAARQGRFDSVAAVIFAFQDSLGRRSWTWFAQRGGVADTAAFAACARERGDAAAIAADIAAGERLGVRGTPTIIMNEWRFSLPPSGEAMDSMVKAILRRR